MREIKFRAWNPVLKRMSYGRDLQHIGMQYSTSRDSWVVLNTVEGKDVDEILTQFTGLLDKNGKEIYEGDIVKYSLDNVEPENGKTDYIENVTLEGGCFCVDGYTPLYAAIDWDLEVIGNIYETPELLK